MVDHLLAVPKKLNNSAVGTSHTTLQKDGASCTPMPVQRHEPSGNALRWAGFSHRQSHRAGGQMHRAIGLATMTLTWARSYHQ